MLLVRELRDGRGWCGEGKGEEEKGREGEGWIRKAVNVQAMLAVETVFEDD